MKQIIKILLILTIIIHSNFVKAETINWETTRNEVLKNAYDVQLSKIDINISKAKITGAKSEYYPKISAYAYNEYSRDLSGKSNQVVYVGNEVIYGDNIYQNALSLGLSYNLFDFGIRSENLKIAKTDSKSKQAAYYKALRDMELAAIDIYAKALLCSKELTAKKSLLEIQQELHQMKVRLNESGQIDKTKEVAENIKIVELEQNIDKLQSEYKSALNELSFYTQKKYDPQVTYLSDFTSQDKNIVPVNNMIKGSVKEDIRLDLKQSPEYKIYDAEIEKKQSELEIAKKQNLPTFNFQTNYYLYGSDPSSYLHSYDEFGQRGLKFRITTALPIFDGFKNKSERERLTYEIERLKVEKEQKLAELTKTFDKIKIESDYSKLQEETNKKMLELVESNITMLDKLNENKLIEKEVYLNEKMKLLNQKLQVETTQIDDYVADYKMGIINKYANEIGNI